MYSITQAAILKRTGKKIGPFLYTYIKKVGKDYGKAVEVQKLLMIITFLKKKRNPTKYMTSLQPEDLVRVCQRKRKRILKRNTVKMQYERC